MFSWEEDKMRDALSVDKYMESLKGLRSSPFSSLVFPSLNNQNMGTSIKEICLYSALQ